ncbi:MAG: 2-phosphosulfolactate phosphatase [Nitrososphaerota archaeon]|nr:2-phosphosulfolactate phosphatase [Nitrososphaerota archaeon]
MNMEMTAKDGDMAVKRGDLIIVVDALRCTSSIVTALSNNAKAVIPTRSLKGALYLKRNNPEYLTAGERGGLKPRGFDFGNSPLEFTCDRVCGKTLIFSTTSGTLALTNVKDAPWILLGSFLNASAAASKSFQIAYSNGLNITILLSGSQGRFSLEDFLCGGAIVKRLSKMGVNLSDAAFAALLSFERAESNLLEHVMRGAHAKKLAGIGFKKDVEFSCQLDIFDTVPFYKEGVIKLLI